MKKSYYRYGVLILGIISVLALPSYAQITFIRNFDGTGYEVGNSVQQTQDGGYILVGLTTSYGAGNYDIYLLKTNAYGDTLWTKIGSGLGAGSSIRTIPNGYITAGYTGSGSATDIALIKTDLTGNFLWTRTFDAGGLDYAQQVEPTSDGGYIMTGFTNSYASHNIVLIKTDANGNAGIEEEGNMCPTDRLSQIYPNPASSYFVVHSPLSVDKVAVYDVTGKIVKEFKNFGVGEIRVSLADIKNGIYIVRVNDAIVKEKLVVTR